MASNGRVRGVVVKLFPTRGFGFIKDASGANYFVHAREIPPIGTFDKLRVGTEVSFVPTHVESGLRATAVEVIG